MINCVAIITQNGRILIVRRFTHSSDSNIEGHLGAFPQLVKNSGHNYIDTETSRLVYQEVGDLYVIISVSKDTNIIEALDAVTLFVDVTRSVVGEIVEDKIIVNAIDLIFAYDECVFDGFVRNIIVSDVSRFLKMESATEAAYLKELEAKVAQQREAIKAHEASVKGKPIPQSQTFTRQTEFQPSFASQNEFEPSPSTYSTPKTTGMQLGKGMRTSKARAKAVMAEEGLTMQEEAEPVQKPVENTGFQIQFEEKFNATVSRQGIVSEISWDGRLYANSNQKCKRQIALQMPETNKFLLRPMQQADKKLFTNSKCLVYDNITTGFQPGVRGAIFGWKRSSKSADDLPIKVTCWVTQASPSSTFSGEISLKATDKEFSDLTIKIPIENADRANVSSIDGEYEIIVDKSVGKSFLLWKVSELNMDNDHAEIEFSIQVDLEEDGFFPIVVNFNISEIFCPLDVVDVTSLDDEDNGEQIKYIVTKNCTANKFEIE